MKALLFLFILCFCSITSFAEPVPLILNNHTNSEKLLNIEMIKTAVDLFNGDQKAISTNRSLNTLQNNNDRLLLKDIVSDLSKKDNQVNYTCLRNLFNDILLCFRSSTSSSSLSACVKAAYATYLACK